MELSSLSQRNKVKKKKYVTPQLPQCCSPDVAPCSERQLQVLLTWAQREWGCWRSSSVGTGWQANDAGSDGGTRQQTGSCGWHTVDTITLADTDSVQLWVQTTVTQRQCEPSVLEPGRKKTWTMKKRGFLKLMMMKSVTWLNGNATSRK